MWCGVQEGGGKGEEDDLDDLDDEAGNGAGKPLKTTFELNDTLYAEAELEDADTVYLWLGVRFSQIICIHLIFNKVIRQT